jgi:hypothetical protein
MIAAVVRGNVDEVKGWLRDGGDINVVEGKWGTTPLMAACAPSERISVLKYLLNSIPKVTDSQDLLAGVCRATVPIS